MLQASLIELLDVTDEMVCALPDPLVVSRPRVFGRIGESIFLEMFPAIRYSNGTQYFPTDADGKAQRFAYSKVQLLVTNKITDSNGYQNFGFIGHAHNVVGDQLTVKGSGYLFQGNYQRNITGSLVQFSQGRLGPQRIYPVYDINVVIFMPYSDTAGKAYVFNALVNTPLVEPSHVGAENNDFLEEKIQIIPCSNYEFN